MISSFVVTLIECLEIAFITLLLSQSDSNGKLKWGAIIGLIAGIFSAYFLHEALENYEWLMYTILSALFFYLFFSNRDIAKHIKEHFEQINGTTSVALALVTVFFIYGRESFEIFSNLFLNPDSSYISAAIAAGIATIIFVFARNSEVKRYVFKYGYIAYLGFGIWFGYEALEHLHIL